MTNKLLLAEHTSVLRAAHDHFIINLLIFLLLGVDVDNSYVYSKAEQICSANLPFFLVKPLEVT